MERSVRAVVSRQVVPIAAGVLALVSMALVPPSAGYLDYIDVRTLCILFCLMAVVAGISSCGAFEALAHRVLEGRRGTGVLCLLLVLLPTACSVFITNDVALLTFVPFAVAVLGGAGRRDLMVPVIVLQTLGANAGSMATPFGNPQNLFISSVYGLGFWDVVLTVLPIVVAGVAVVCVLAFIQKGDEVHVDFEEPARVRDRGILAVMCVLFVLCIAAVLRWIPYQVVLVVVLIAVLVLRRSALLRVDYGLLLTFVFLFVFVGNVSQVDAVREALEGLMSWSPVLASAGLSQIVSNVPAAVTLSGFTADWQGLLIGTNIGGFGTPIASMASIISLRIYSGTEGADTRRFLVVFTAANVLMMIILVPIGLAVHGLRRRVAVGLLVQPADLVRVLQIPDLGVPALPGDPALDERLEVGRRLGGVDDQILVE
ncbi:MAG: SLC13 family permease [Thermoplasmata archaeon]|nr:SLC13 family permease [Thermoplasmata archaeon]